MSDGLRASWGDDSTARARLSSMAQTSLSQRDANAVLVVNQNAAGVVCLAPFVINALWRTDKICQERKICEIGCRVVIPDFQRLWVIVRVAVHNKASIRFVAL